MKKFNNITDKQLKAKGVQALSDRPNASAQYGVSNLSPAQLKLWFDKLSLFLAYKINNLGETFASGEAAEYIRITLDEYGIDSLAALVNAMISGSLVQTALQVVPNINFFGTVPLQKWIFDFTEQMYEHFSDGYYDPNAGAEEIVLTRGNGNELRISLSPVYDYVDEMRKGVFTMQVAPPLAEINNAVLLAAPTLSQLAVHRKE